MHKHWSEKWETNEDPPHKAENQQAVFSQPWVGLSIRNIWQVSFVVIEPVHYWQELAMNHPRLSCRKYQD